MNFKKIIPLIKKQWFSILFYGLLLVFIFSPAAKSWLLQQLVSTGLFNAEIKKENKQFLVPAGFSFSDSMGKIASISDFKGKIVFVNFWASWCPPCRAEMSSLNELYLKLHADQRFVFLFINEDEDKQKGINYIQKEHLAIPFYYRTGEISQEIFSGSLPTTVVLDKDGKVVLKHTGMALYNTDEFIKQLKSLL
jgi:thiol-disulfide isomerase/thioredoxin